VEAASGGRVDRTGACVGSGAQAGSTRCLHKERLLLIYKQGNEQQDTTIATRGSGVD
jgi:hypothetical protein